MIKELEFHSFTLDKMSLRQRKKTFSKTVEDLDAFPKVPDSYVVEQEASNAIGNVFQKITTLIQFHEKKKFFFFFK